MKRIEPLIPFSHDHHHALSQARRLRRAADLNCAGRRKAVTAFLEFYTSETLAHFRDEEELLFPCASDVQNDELHAAIDAALREHVEIRERASALQVASALGMSTEPAALRELAVLLTAHVRFEERVVFHLLQEHAVLGSRLRASTDEFQALIVDADEDATPHERSTR
jgi:iron-sulfur cluster repair protein YtfE (RIC family)